MQLDLIIGLLTVGLGLYLLLFTSLADTGGIEGILLIVLLITVGVFLLVPSKNYIILSLMRRERKR